MTTRRDFLKQMGLATAGMAVASVPGIAARPFGPTPLNSTGEKVRIAYTGIGNRGEQNIRDGWKLLWDGQTTEGWRGSRLAGFPEKGWHITDGVLVVEDAEGKENSNGGDIVTTELYGNFILKVDFKITAGANSGIKYFVYDEYEDERLADVGCEFQVLDDERHPDAKLGVKGNRTLGSLYDLIPAPDEKPFVFDDWNTAVVVAKGNHVEHWLNGVKLLEYERNNQEWNALVANSKFKNWPNFGNLEKGHILIQDHGNEVWYKNIKIKEL